MIQKKKNTIKIRNITTKKYAIVLHQAILDDVPSKHYEAFKTIHYLVIDPIYYINIIWFDRHPSFESPPKKTIILRGTIKDRRLDSQETLIHLKDQYLGLLLPDAYLITKEVTDKKKKEYKFLVSAQIKNKKSLWFSIDYLPDLAKFYSAAPRQDLHKQNELYYLYLNKINELKHQLANDRRPKKFTAENIKRMLGLPDRINETDFCLTCNVKLNRKKEFEENGQKLFCSFCLSELESEFHISKSELIELLKQISPSQMGDAGEIIFCETGMVIRNKFFTYRSIESKVILKLKCPVSYCNLKFYSKEAQSTHYQSAHLLLDREHKASYYKMKVDLIVKKKNMSKKKKSTNMITKEKQVPLSDFF